MREPDHAAPTGPERRRNDATGHETVEDHATRSHWGLTAVDPEFDAAVLALAEAALPEGYDVAEDAPGTFEALKAHAATGARQRVWSGASGFTIYGSPDVNYAFRAWHDRLHLMGNHDFSLAGEAAVAWRQAEQMRARFGNHPNHRAWRASVYAEVLGQWLYADLNRDFPGNQRLFVKRFVELLLEEQAPGAEAAEPLRRTIKRCPSGVRGRHDTMPATHVVGIQGRLIMSARPG